ncbi:hypothetical protein OYE22_32710 [Streptomyces sp. 71268]|uniref:hypothetical protein n=1 Tax=Streptomyces sp. 71268 TaxID=3002640 RepID=UPI0023F9057B|nr:hypothetical protein [Streptomyces sp. 71268]WEV29425.1 hypothetical protein OYE22_32710 [Streptomyces sp. 71268]
MSTDDGQRVRNLLLPHLMGQLDDSSATLDVQEIEVVSRGRSFDVVLELLAYGERWRVRLPRDNSDSILFNGAPAPHVVRSVANMIRIHLFEWWHTKDRERRSAAMGERLS